ncbi:ABC transporter permease [uncultured Microbacterium sp.]|uniref:ABC transporter permease n=1 Tax=uncultured Microbacterium sp. TaxID=191216 RepID=UPI0026329EBB|nr:ABC transporter permease [uncultured Microbacterium sp.]
MTDTLNTITNQPRARRRGARKPSALGRAINALPQPAAIALAVAVFLAVWQLIVMSGAVPRIILPGPWDVAQQVGIVTMQFFQPNGFLLGQLWVTVQEILIGFLCAVVAGFLIGLWIGLSEFGRKAVLPLFVMLEATPKIAFIPVFIAWFGFGMSSKIVMAAFLSLFPVIIGTVSGLNATSVEERKLFASFNASPWMTFWKLRLHRALPFIFAGLKIAVVSSVTGAVAAEFIGGGTGFGEQIRVAATRIDIDRVFAMILFLSLLGLVLFMIVAWLQRAVTYWDTESTPRRARSKY